MLLNILKELAGPLWPMLKIRLAGVSVKIDAKAKAVTITKNGQKKTITFEQIEQAINQN